MSSLLVSVARRSELKAARSQEYPISLASPAEHRTLLDGKNVTFSPADGGDSGAPEWARVVLDGAVRLVAMKEVSLLPILCLHGLSVALNSR